MIRFLIMRFPSAALEYSCLKIDFVQKSLYIQTAFHRATAGDGHTPAQIVNNTPIRDPTETEQNGHHLSHVLSSVSVSSLWQMLPKTVTFLYQPFLYLWSHTVDLKSVKNQE